MVTGSHITLNLSGHTIDGAAGNNGILVTGTNVTIENGTVTDFQIGVRPGAANGRAQNVTAFSTATGCTGSRRAGGRR